MMRNNLPIPLTLPPKLEPSSGLKHVPLSDRNAALLLTSLTEIASKEIDRNCHALDDCSSGTVTTPHSTMARIRTISMDKPDDWTGSDVEGSAIGMVRRAFMLGVGSVSDRVIPPKNNSDEPVAGGYWRAVVSDSSTPNSPLQIGAKFKYTRASYSKKRKNSKQGPVVRSSDRKRSCKNRSGRQITATSDEVVGTTSTSVSGTRTILRRKFSWKNYPEVRMIGCMMICLFLNRVSMDHVDVSLSEPTRSVVSCQLTPLPQKL